MNVLTPAVLSTLRTLKRVNPGDTYYEEYLKKFAANPDFFDQYHLAWQRNQTHRIKRIMEIGTRAGGSLCQMLAGMTDYDGVQVVSFDLFNDGYISPALVRMNLKALNIPESVIDSIQFIKGNAAETVPQYFEQHPDAFFDWVLVDGDHSRIAARLDLETAWPRVAIGGLLVFDDISTAPGECGLIEVWEAFKETHPTEFIYQENMSGKGTAWGERI